MTKNLISIYALVARKYTGQNRGYGVIQKNAKRHHMTLHFIMNPQK
jgi:hypothetical protein